MFWKLKIFGFRRQETKRAKKEKDFNGYSIMHSSGG